MEEKKALGRTSLHEHHSRPLQVVLPTQLFLTLLRGGDRGAFLEREEGGVFRRLDRPVSALALEKFHVTPAPAHGNREGPLPMAMTPHCP